MKCMENVIEKRLSNDNNMGITSLVTLSIHSFKLTYAPNNSCCVVVNYLFNLLKFKEDDNITFPNNRITQ